MGTNDKIAHCQWTRLLFPATDRLGDAEFQLRGMLQNYHDPGGFRSTFGAFTKAVLEVPMVLKQTMQSNKAFCDWLEPRKKLLGANPVRKALYDERNDIVHQRQAALTSSFKMGIHDGRGFRLEMAVKGHDQAPTDGIALECLKDEGGPIASLVRCIDETEFIAIQRTWQLEGIEGEISDACKVLWRDTAMLVAEGNERLGGPLLPLDAESTFPTYKKSSLLFFSRAGETNDRDGKAR